MRYRTSLITTISVFLLMMIGTIVVGLDAGMACPDWPLCNGKVVPVLEGKVIIEYVHRIMSTVVGFLVIINAWMQWKNWKGYRGLQMIALSTVPLLGIVAFLGGWNVMKQLPSGFTTIDLTVSFLLVGALVILTSATKRTPITEEQKLEESNKNLHDLYKPAIVVTIAIFLQNAFGGFIRHSDASVTYFGKEPVWGQALVSSQVVAEWLVGIHMFITFVITICVMWIVFMAVQKKVLKGFAFTLLGLLVSEAIFGLISLMTEFAFEVVTIHLAIGTLMLMISIHMSTTSKLGTTYVAKQSSPTVKKSSLKLSSYQD